MTEPSSQPSTDLRSENASDRSSEIASTPPRMLLPLALAAAVGLAAAHFLLTPPLVALAQGQLQAAAGAWFFAPATLAALAFLVGQVQPGQARATPALRPHHIPLFAALVAPLTLGVMSLTNTPARFRPVTWLSESATLGLMLGLGLALAALFWQGAVQQHLFKTLPLQLRALVVAMLSLMPPAAFLMHPQTSEALRDGLLPELLASTLVLAALHEAGLSHRLVALNAIVLGVGIGVLNHALLI
ncbi:hypothetical protein FRC98_12845 [Lujinxingia vulgaris]|uniref:Uncharacterized protein n=1 Tax=Lujinxingia vulgaris TaxID=2600176 RepID=A0A5C6X6A1_9DELT|nr:hypothetical protein [Lujinxingia vulgaris]TXD36710.1 hypothetical protein FRC98_12845 [Lujinxingia vulgaris]